MKKFDNFYKDRNLKINAELINTYVRYNDKHILICNNSSILLLNEIPLDFKENKDIKYCDLSIKYFDNFTNKTNKYIETIDIDVIKNSLYDNRVYKLNKEWGISYTRLKKIINIIGYEKINIVSINDVSIVIEIVGKKGQVGYLLPIQIF